jgi:cytochrome c-type biogenesis protein CcmH
MSFWIITIGLTFVAVLAVLAPLVRGGDRADPDGGHDAEVYRAQLDELDRDMARGAIGAEDAETARAEIARRLLRANAETKEGDVNAKAPKSPFSKMLAYSAVIAVPVIAWSYYAMLGSPGMPDEPLAARLSKPASQSTMAELVAKAERQLQANPDDSQGWDVLAPIYLSIGRFDDSVSAYENAIRLDGSTLKRESGLGEALVAQSKGKIGPEARDAFRKALSIEPKDPRARFYLAMADAQDGKLGEAAAQWEELAGEAPAGSQIGKFAARAAADARTRMSGGSISNAPVAPGPDSKDVEAAGQMSPQDRLAMIETMVAGLDKKLRENPHDPEGWKRLIRSYMVLQKDGKAADALARAIEVLGKDSSEAADIRTFAGSLGVKAD